MADSRRNKMNEDPYNDEDIRPEPLQQRSPPPITYDAEEKTAGEEEVASDEKTPSKDHGQYDADDQHSEEQESEDSYNADSSIPSGNEAQQEAFDGDWPQDVSEDFSARPIGTWNSSASANFGEYYTGTR